jgi:hypothetical protein
MKNLIKKFLFGKDPILSGVFAIGIVSLIALGCTCGKNFDLANVGKTDSSNSSSTSDSSSSDQGEDTDLPDKRLLKALVAETTADFAAAITTEDFSSIYSKSSSDLQSSVTESEMKEKFSPFFGKKKQVIPILAKTLIAEPEFSPEPYIRTEQGNSILVAHGQYKVKPNSVRFEYEYVRRGGEWKLLVLKVFIN